MANLAHTVLLGPDGLRLERALYSASTPITPGMLIQYHSGALTVEPHSTDGGAATPWMVAVEEPENTGHGISDAYTVAGEIVQVDFPYPGLARYMLLAAGENITAGQKLDSAGDGTLEASDGTAVARALEAVNNSAGYTAVRIRVEVL
jgi:hypothetical protein